MKHTYTSIYDDLRTRLSVVRRKQLTVEIATGLLSFLIIALCLVILFAVSESLFHFTSSIRTALVSVSVLGLLGLIAWLVIIPAMKLVGVLPGEDDHEIARKIGGVFPAIKDHLLDILQLYPERKAEGLYSTELIDASFQDVYDEVKAVDLPSGVDKREVAKRSRILFLSGVFGSALFIFFSPTLSEALNRLVNYSVDYVVPPPFRLVVEPGNKEVVKGNNVDIRIRIIGEYAGEPILYQRPDGQREFDATPLQRQGDMFQYSIPSIKYTTSYYASAADIRSNEYALTVIDRPIVKMLRLSLDYPLYTRLGKKDMDDNLGDVSSPRGTTIKFSVESSKSLSHAAVIYDNGTTVSLDVTRKKASGSVVLMKERTYHIDLMDIEGLTNANPIEYRLKVVPDAFPSAMIILPGRNLDVTEGESLSMLIKISDDYGFSGLRLAYRLAHSRYEQSAEEFTTKNIPFTTNNNLNEQSIAYRWDLKGLALVPEDVVAYYVEVFDNDAVSGPKSARSETYTLRLPSIDEVFAEVDKGHETSLEGLKDALKDAQEGKKALDELHREMKKNQDKADWQEQKKAEELVQKYEEIQKKLEEVQKAIDKAVEEMSKNQLLSKETLEKYQELQQMMQDMSSPEFAEAMKKFQQAMQQLSPEAMRQAMQNFQFSEENFRKNIERTMNLLKRIQIEQKVDEAVKRMEELSHQQEEVSKQTAETNPDNKERLRDLAQQQQDMQQDLQRLQEELAELQKKMEEFPTEMPLKEMEEARKALEESNLDQEMRDIAQMMEQQQLQEAQQRQKRAMKKMGKLLQNLQQMQQALRENQQRQIVNEMRKALQELLTLSQRQEKLKEESKSLDPNSQRFRENAQEQMQAMRDLSSVAQRLSQVGQKSLGITPEMGKSMGDAMKNMSEAMESLEQRNGTRAAQQQEAAMAALNATAGQVQSAMNAMMQGGNGQGMGMAGFMQRLQQMSQQQQGINQGTQNMGGLTPQQAAEMARLAGEQGVVRKSLEQLAREASNAGELSKMLGDLRSVAQEMREVQTDLAQGNVNPETLRKQDRILSRLLDSQRSARERDFEKQRRAEVGSSVTKESSGEINLATQEGRNRLRQDLQRAIDEGYVKDYEVLIRKYFEALQNYESREQ